MKNKGYKMFSTKISFKPANEVEVTLSILPKQCSCSACQSAKDSAKNSLGEKRYISVCKALGLAA